MVRFEVCVPTQGSKAVAIGPIGQIGHLGHTLASTPICPGCLIGLIRLKFSTDSVEINVEINTEDFTKLLQTRIYNILHTSAARPKLLMCYQLTSFNVRTMH